MNGIRKRFGSTIALSDVSLKVLEGEVHALVGENGAGKSTLMKILSGAETPDTGTMELDGKPFVPRGPRSARQAGVAMIYQELALAPHLDVEANVMLGIEEHTWGFLRSASHRRRVEEALRLLDHPEIRVNTPVSQLTPGARQLVEVARALVGNARTIVFDEPTSSLTRKDTEHLFSLIHRLKERGVSVLYISHFLEEVQRIADRYTVLRDGQSVTTGTVANTSPNEIIRQMVGRSLQELFPKVPHERGAEVLRVQGVCGKVMPTEVNLVLHRGEILGVFGLVGAGRTELMRVLYGLDPLVNGKVFVDGRSSPVGHPKQRIRSGFGLLSEDRKHEGLALIRSIADNTTYSRLSPYCRTIFLNLAERRRKVQTIMKELQVRHRDVNQPVSELSGGNQQKIAIGRLLHQEAEVFLLDEPTRGVDVGSKAEIYRLMGELAAAGKSILFVSSYLPELLGVCDTLTVMTRGRLSMARPVSQWTEESVMAAATGGKHEQ